MVTVIENPLSSERITVQGGGGDPAGLERENLPATAGLAQDRHTTGRALPRPLCLAVFMRDFARKVPAPYLPEWPMRPVARLLTRLAAWSGAEARYRVLRDDSDGQR